MRYLKNNGILARCTDMYRDERFRPLGLNSRQSVLLLQVCRNSGVKQDALSKAIWQVRVFPTEKALALLPEIRAGFREWREYLQEGLTEEELELFCGVMDKVTRRAAAWCGRMVTQGEEEP